ncbi:MAG: FMN-binding protein [Nocardioidaceae bacterium]
MSRHAAPTSSTRRRGYNPLDVARRRTKLRRAAALAGMFAAVGGLVTLRSTLAPGASPAASAAGLAAPVHASSTQPTKPARKHHHHHAKAAQPSSRPRPTHRVVTGNAYNVGYGIVQVKVTMVGKRITDVTALSLPSGGNSSSISSYAGPQLRQEALSAQSAHIDAVSGASYTSAGYVKSLQSALDKAAQG